MAKWEKVDAKIYILETTISYVAECSGQARSQQIVLRIDGREGTYRVDLYDPLMRFWEAKDGGRGFATVREAQVFASSWRAAVVVQGTLSPRVEV